MITVVTGDIFRSPAQVLTNSVNTVGAMGKGLALEFKIRYPDMYQDYSMRCGLRLVKLGEPYLWENEYVQILNFPTKRHWNDESKYKYIEQGLQYLVDNYSKLGICSIALPLLGCGYGGLHPMFVQQLIETYLSPLPGLEAFLYVH